MKKYKFFKVEGNRISRIRKYCPKCGPAIFLAEHKNRFSCGQCGYTEFKGGGPPSKQPPVAEKPVERSIEQKAEVSVKAPAQEPTTVEVTPTEEDETKPDLQEISKEEETSEEIPKEESSEPKQKQEKPADESDSQDKEQ